jgi:hypothetical protein
MPTAHAERRQIHQQGLWGVLLVLMIAAAAWLLLHYGDDGRDSDVAASPSVPTADPRFASGDVIAGAPAPVNDYLHYQSEHRARTDADHSHTYTAGALRHLATALSALLQRDAGAGAPQWMQIADLRKRANDLQRDPSSLEHARYAHDAFTTASDVLQWLQQRTAPRAAIAAADVRTAAQALDPSVPLLEQRGALQAYFAAVGTALHRILARSS